MLGRLEGGGTSTDKTTRRDCCVDDGLRRKYIEMPPSSMAVTCCALPIRISILSRALQ